MKRSVNNKKVVTLYLMSYIVTSFVQAVAVYVLTDFIAFSRLDVYCDKSAVISFIPFFVVNNCNSCAVLILWHLTAIVIKW